MLVSITYSLIQKNMTDQYKKNTQQYTFKDDKKYRNFSRNDSQYWIDEKDTIYIYIYIYIYISSMLRIYVI